MKIKLIISYDGTDFCGWQSQKNGVSVQSVIEDAIYKITNERVSLIGSGRTDAGVHASFQVAGFSIKNSTLPPEKYYKALNTVLPDSVKILKSSKVDDNFNAREDAKKKTYRYSMYLSDVIKPLKERYSTKINPNIDVKKMKNALSLFSGEKNFKAFNASGGGAKTFVRTVYDIKLIKDGEDLSLYITGNGFLYNMVRIIAGTLIKLGENKIDEKIINEMFTSGVRPYSIKTLPAKGLCLINVEYV